MTDYHEPRSAIFRRKIRQLRAERGWSQAELGRRVGLGQSRTAAIEASGSVTIDQADAFATAFGVPIEVLLYSGPPAAASAIQVHRLQEIAHAFDQARDDIGRLIDQARAAR